MEAIFAELRLKPRAESREFNAEQRCAHRRGICAFAADRANKPASELRIAIGRDSRLSGEQLTVWLADGIASVGANAYDGGLASTPAMFMCCVNELHFDAGIMVTGKPSADGTQRHEIFHRNCGRA